MLSIVAAYQGFAEWSLSLFLGLDHVVAEMKIALYAEICTMSTTFSV